MSELSSFATLALYRFDLAAGALTLVNAGHTPGLLVRAEDGPIETILGNNIPIGVLADEIYQQSTVAIGPGDKLLTYSDGITETRNASGEEFGPERLIDLVQAARQSQVPPTVLLQSMRYQLRTFAGSQRLVDDQTALLVELCTGHAGDEAACACRYPHTLVLPWRLAALSRLREAIGLAAVAVPETELAALTLAAFEVATNAIRHAPQSLSDGTIACRLRCAADRMSVELIYPTDAVFVPEAGPAPDFDGQKEGGFGLFIIHNSVDEVAYAAPLPGVGSVRLVKRF